MSNRLQALFDEGVSVWVDSLSREMLRSGRLAKWIADDGVRGQTSNPTIFEGAISKGKDYDPQSKELADQGMHTEAIAWELMVTDVRAACDVFRPLYDSSGGTDGFVSLELHPGYAHETEKSLVQARELWKRVDRPNLMLKVPGTTEGLPVVEQLLYEGFNINVTLLFSVARYGEVIEAHQRALERRHSEGKPLTMASVASFFVSRVDSEADKRLDKLAAQNPDLGGKISDLRGEIAVANARLAYALFEKRYSTERWEKLAAAGARVQRPLWASTSTKNPSYPDTLYVHELIGAHCVNTMPVETMDAFRDHGVVAVTLNDENLVDAKEVLANLAVLGVDLDDICLNTLVVEGVKKFYDSYQSLLAAVEANVRQLQHAS
ncbi:MAG: transaldolase [Candidatus Eremiobacterota bacterium]